ncbi:MAG: alanine racemase [Prevotellaceae bacterium]|jgi:D-serine deaminase-like pyridoxal phosphate-dependent protein|nr:alanine racemase [Prevotellaceae bacterium]
MNTQKTTTFNSLETPCLLLDRKLMERNFINLSNRLQSFGVSLRPHMKTVKSIDVAKDSFKEADVPITVSTLKEAEEFAKAGFTDMIYAVGISPNKPRRIQQIRAGGVKLRVILDSVEQAEILSKYVQNTKDPIQVLIEVDCDGQRSGVKPDDKDNILKIAYALKEGGAILEGVLSHSGGSYSSKSIDEIAQAAERERIATVGVANILRENGCSAPIVSIGSTPAAYFAKDFTGVTEVRAGVFMFQDLVMAGIGVCTPNDIAISVLTTVIGHQAEKGWIIVDAGWMAMSRDRGTANQKADMGYGLACNERGDVIENLTMISAAQEHGVLAFRDGRKDVHVSFPAGTMLRILPNHACATAAQFQEYQVIENNKVADIWSRFNGW